MSTEREQRNSGGEIEVRRAGRSAKLVGHAAVFNTLSGDLGGFQESIARGAFRESIARDDVRALFNHNPDHVLGRVGARTLRLSEDSRGLEFEITPPDNSIGETVAELVRRGDVRENSFGFICQDEGVLRREPPVRELRKVKLLDISPVTYPAYPDTDVAVRRMRSQVGWTPGAERAPVRRAGGLSAPGGLQPAPSVEERERRVREVAALENMHAEAIGTHFRFGDLDPDTCLGGGRVVLHGLVAPYDYPSRPIAKRGGAIEYIRRGAFARTLYSRDGVRANAWHKGAPFATRSAGRVRLYEAWDGLRFVIVPPDTDDALEAARRVRNGELSGASAGFTIHEDRKFWANGREVRDADIYEISLVDGPAYPAATVRASWVACAPPKRSNHPRAGAGVKRRPIMRDLHNNTAVAQTIAAADASGGITGGSVDLTAFDAFEVILNVGAGSGDGDYAVTVEASNDNASWSPVDSALLNGSFTSNIDTGSDLIEQVGYLGVAKYLRVSVTENSAGTTAPTVGALVQRASARVRPV